MTPFPAPPHQTVRADFPHTAFGVPALSQACAGVSRLGLPAGDEAPTGPQSTVVGYCGYPGPRRWRSRLALRCSLSWSSRTFSSGVLGPRFRMTIASVLPSISSMEQPGSLRSTGVTPLPRYCEPLRLLPWPQPFSVVSLCGRVTDRLRTKAGLPSCARVLSRRAVPPTPPQPHADCACCSAWDVSLRPVSRGSACELKFLEALMGSRLLRPAGSPPSHPRGRTA